MFILRALIAAVLLLAPAAPALAHADQVTMTPAANSVVTTAPAEVVLGFSEKINPLGTVVVVIAPDGTQVQVGDARVTGQRVIATVGEFEQVGKYRVNYRIVSADGHAVSGTRSFSYAPDGVVAPTAPTISDAEVAERQSQLSWGISPAILLSIAMIFLIAAAVAISVTAARRRGRL